MKPIFRNIIILIIVVLLGGVGYFMFFKNNAPTSALQTTSPLGTTTDTTNTVNSTDVNNLTQDFLSQVSNIQSIKIDDSIFSNKAFLSLQDFNRPIPVDPNPGRPNPFAPIGSDSNVVSTQISTSNASSITPTTATLNGSLTLNDPTVVRWFEYGTTNSLGTITIQKPQIIPGAFSEAVSGLQPNTTYYVKAMASMSGVTLSGNMITWKTAQPPTVKTKK